MYYGKTLIFLEKMTESKLPKRPLSGGTHNGVRPQHFEYWRVGYGERGDYALDFWVEQAGEYHSKPDHSLPHYDYFIDRWVRVFYLMAGEATCTFDKKIVLLRAGDLLVVPPNYPFTYRAQQANQYHWFAMAGNWPRLLGNLPRILKFSPGYDAELEANFVEIREMLIVKRPGYPLKAVSRFYNLLARLEGLQQGKLPTTSTSIYPEAVRNAVIYLQENWSQPFSAKETAVHVHISQSHLRALFEKWVGESPKRYHTRCRIERAMRLFRNQRLPVQVVAAQVGFNDVGYFSRVFKQIAGVLPSQYAKMPREM